MTITSNTTSITWAGNGATQEFYYNFLIPSPGQCSLVYTAGGVATVVAPGLFSIAGTGQPGGGSLVYPLTGSPIPAGTTLTLTRVVPLQQAYHPAVNGPIYNPDLESALDTLELQIQQVNAGLGFLEIDGTDINALSISGAVSLSLSGTTLDVVVNTTPGPVGPTGAAGDVGATPTIYVAAVSLASGSQPTVTLSGTALDPEITFGLVTGPAGENGANGAPGAVGATGPQGPQGVPGVGSSIIIENNGTAFSTAATAINFEGAGGTITMAGETVTVDLTGGGGSGGSLTITDGSTTLSDISELLVTNLGLQSVGGSPAIVQYANFPNGGNVSLGQAVKVGNTIVICTVGQQPPSSFGGLDLAVQSGGFPDGIAFYAGIASSVVSPEASISCPASIFEISGVISTVTSAVAVANSSSTYSIPFSDVNANSFVLVATNAVGNGNNNNGAGSTDFTPNETYKIQYSVVSAQSVGGLIFGVPDPVTVDSELTFNDPENPYTQAILIEFVGSASAVPSITPKIPVTINGNTAAPFTSLNVTTTGSSPSASVTGGVLTLGLPVSSGGGGGGGGTGTALTFSGSPVNLSAWNAGGTLNCYKSDQQFTFSSGQKISVTGSFNGQSSYANQQGVFLSKDGVNFYCLMYQESGNVIAYYNTSRGNYFNVPLFAAEFSLELLVYAVAAGGNNYVTGNFEGAGAFVNCGLSDNNLDMTSGEWNVYFSVDNLSQILSGNLAID
jgi:hypothetical protein